MIVGGRLVGGDRRAVAAPRRGPYIGGSQNNSVLELIFGYNGFGRLTGNETGSVVGGGRQGQAACGARPAWSRLFAPTWAVRWPGCSRPRSSLPSGPLWLARRAPRTDGRRAPVLVWGGWLAGHAAVFSFARGSSTPTTRSPSPRRSAALVGIGGWLAWRYRARTESRVVLAAVVLGSAIWSSVLLARSADWYPWLRVAIMLAGVAAAAGLLLPLLGIAIGRRLVAAVAGAALFAGLAGPAAYALDTAATPHTGSIPSAGPVVAGSFGPGRGGAFGGFRGGPAGPGAGRHHRRRGPGWAGGQGGQGGLGGLLDTSTPDSALVALLQQDTSTWAAAAVGSNAAAGSSRLRPADHGHRRLQRLGPEPDARPVQGPRRRRKDPLLPGVGLERSRRRRRLRPRRGLGDDVAIVSWVENTFHEHDGRRGDGLRPRRRRGRGRRRQLAPPKPRRHPPPPATGVLPPTLCTAPPSGAVHSRARRAPASAHPEGDGHPHPGYLMSGR